MKIATWNVNSIRTRLDQVVQWLESTKVDVLCLQETKVEDEKFPRSPFESLGYNLYVSGQKSYNGVAIFSKEPLQDISTGFASILGNEVELDAQKRVISGVIGDLRIVNLYVPNGAEVGGEKYEYKLRWLKVLRQYLDVLLKQPYELCVCGDFNIALEDRDIHNPKGREKHIMASPAERQLLREVLEVGLADGFRKFTQDAGHFSWWDYRANAFPRNMGWRIDHHYLTANLYEKAIACTIDTIPRTWQQPSDHTPVIIEF